MKIELLHTRKNFNSRGELTVECGVETSLGIFWASVPSGKSTGKTEALSLPFSSIKKSVEIIKKNILEKEFSSIREFDETLLMGDTTSQKSVLGGNVMLGFSIAFSRARAAQKNISLWLLLRREFFPHLEDSYRPTIFSNVINGGVHAQNGLDIQEYMIVMRPGKTYAEDISLLVEMYKNIGRALQKNSKELLPLGDESGYASRFKDNFEPITIISKIITQMKMNSKCSIGLDAAANSFSAPGNKYRFGGKVITKEQLLITYMGWFKKSKYLCSIEDPFSEYDDASFFSLQTKLKNKWIVGDDITTTNATRIHKLGKQGAIHGVIIKPNQVGTVSEACDAMVEARAQNLKSIVSHRSGETEDPFIISLAKAGGAEGVKIGAPAHERIIKFNELIRIYDKE